MSEQNGKRKPDSENEHTTPDFPIEEWDLLEMTAHPKQKHFFSPLTQAERRALAKDLAENGQREPIELLPDGTIISGHQRRMAMLDLGWKRAKVVIRHDLAAAGDAAIERRLIEANCSRRQLSKLHQARLYVRLRELEPQGADRRGRGELRDEIAKRFGLSGRNLDRYVELVGHPKELQDAVERKSLSLVKALQLMKLENEKVQPILAKLRDGHDVRRQVNRLLLDVTARAPMTTRRLQRLLRDFIRVGVDLAEHQQTVQGLVLQSQAKKLLSVRRLSKKLLEALEGKSGPNFSESGSRVSI